MQLLSNKVRSKLSDSLELRHLVSFSLVAELKMEEREAEGGRRSVDPSTPADFVTVGEWSSLIMKLFAAVRALFDIQSPYISKQQFDMFQQTLNTLTEVSEDKREVGRQRRRKFDSIDIADIDRVLQADYQRFVSTIEANPEVQRLISLSTFGIIDQINALPLQSADVESDLRYESFIGKLVSHVRFMVGNSAKQLSMDEEASKTTIWVLNIFRRMIEREWGMTIDERDEKGGLQQDQSAQIIQQTLTDCGVPRLAIELISMDTSQSIGFEAVILLVAMLFREVSLVCVPRCGDFLFNNCLFLPFRAGIQGCSMQCGLTCNNHILLNSSID